MKKYSIALIPASESGGFNAYVIKLANHLSVVQGGDPAYLPHDQQALQSLPHIPVYHFELDEDHVDEILRLIWHEVQLSWHELHENEVNRGIYVALSDEISCKGGSSGFVTGATRADIVLGDGAPVVIRFHLSLLEKLQAYGVQALTAHGVNYTPYFTLFNSVKAQAQLENLITETPSDLEKPRKSAFFIPVLGLANENWEFVELLRAFDANISAIEMHESKKCEDYKPVARTVDLSLQHFTLINYQQDNFGHHTNKTALGQFGRETAERVLWPMRKFNFYYRLLRSRADDNNKRNLLYLILLFAPAAVSLLFGGPLRCLEFESRHQGKVFNNNVVQKIPFQFDHVQLFYLNAAMGHDGVTAMTNMPLAMERVNRLVEIVRHYLRQTNGNGFFFLQEIWHEGVARILEESFVSMFSTVISRVGRNTGSSDGCLMTESRFAKIINMDSGSMFMTRHPVSDYEFRRFRFLDDNGKSIAAELAGNQSYPDRGFLSINTRSIEGSSLCLTATHLPGDDESYDAAQASNIRIARSYCMQDMTEVLRKKLADESNLTTGIVVGDLNTLLGKQGRPPLSEIAAQITPQDPVEIFIAKHYWDLSSVSAAKKSQYFNQETLLQECHTGSFYKLDTFGQDAADQTCPVWYDRILVLKQENHPVDGAAVIVHPKALDAQNTTHSMPVSDHLIAIASLKIGLFPQAFEDTPNSSGRDNNNCAVDGYHSS